MEESEKITQAWQYLDDALFTSKHVKSKDIEAGSTEWENVYPTSLEEADKMDALIDKAEETIGDQRDEDFNQRVNDLRDITAWSRRRHKTWKWSLIAGAIISAIVFYYFNSSNKEDIKKSEDAVALVKNWTEADTTITYKQASATNNIDYNKRLFNANFYKVYLLNDIKHKEKDYSKYAADFAHMADTASNEKNKERFLKSSQDYTDRAKTSRAKFDTIASMKYAQIKELALKDVEKNLERDKDSAATTTGWLIYLIILIPLYIITGYPYGYLITNHRRQHGFMNGLQKWGFRIAAFFFGTGVLMKLLPDDIVRYRYSDGSTRDESEPNAANFIILALKFGLMLVGIFIFCFISVFIMTVQSITGLKRNFNWGALYNKIKGQKA